MIKKQFKDIKIGQKFNFCLVPEIGMESFVKISRNRAKLEFLINGCEFSYYFKEYEIVEI